MSPTSITNSRQEIVQYLGNTLAHFGAAGMSGDNSNDDLFERVLNLLEQSNLDLSCFFNNPEKSLVFLASVEDFFSRFDESRGKLMNLIKLLAVPESQHGMHGTYTEKMKALYEREFKEKESGMEVGAVVSNYVKNKYVDNSISIFDSWLAHNFITKWSKGSPLGDIRDRMGMDKKSERPMKIVVSSISREMVRELGTPQFVFYSKDGRSVKTTIVLSYGKQKIKNDPIVKGFLEHEYAHAQSGSTGEGLTLGLGGMLYEGLNEALTDGLTTVPMLYKNQRKVVEVLAKSDKKFDLKQLLHSSYMGDENSRYYLIKGLVKQYGLRIISLLARMSFKSNVIHYSHASKMADSLFAKPEEILKYVESCGDRSEGVYV